MTYTWTEVETWMKNNELSASKLSQMLTGRSGATTVFAWRRTKRIGGKYAIKPERLKMTEAKIRKLEKRIKELEKKLEYVYDEPTTPVNDQLHRSATVTGAGL